MDLKFRDVRSKSSTEFLTPVRRNDRSVLKGSRHIKSRSKSDTCSPFSENNYRDAMKTLMKSAENISFHKREKNRIGSLQPRTPLQTLSVRHDVGSNTTQIPTVIVSECSTGVASTNTSTPLSRGREFHSSSYHNTTRAIFNSPLSSNPKSKSVERNLKISNTITNKFVIFDENVDSPSKANAHASRIQLTSTPIYQGQSCSCNRNSSAILKSPWSGNSRSKSSERTFGTPKGVANKGNSFVIFDDNLVSSSKERAPKPGVHQSYLNDLRVENSSNDYRNTAEDKILPNSRNTTKANFNICNSGISVQSLCFDDPSILAQDTFVCGENCSPSTYYGFEILPPTETIGSPFWGEDDLNYDLEELLSIEDIGKSINIWDIKEMNEYHNNSSNESLDLPCEPELEDDCLPSLPLELEPVTIELPWIDLKD